MCIPSLSTPVNQSDPNAMKGRFFQVIANAMMAGRGDIAAKARLQSWKTMVQSRAPTVGPAPSAAPAATATPGPTAQAMGRP